MFGFRDFESEKIYNVGWKIIHLEVILVFEKENLVEVMKI